MCEAINKLKLKTNKRHLIGVRYWENTSEQLTELPSSQSRCNAKTMVHKKGEETVRVTVCPSTFRNNCDEDKMKELSVVLYIAIESLM